MEPLHQTFEVSSEYPQEEEEKEETGPLESRVDSKNWKTRSKAYAELAGLLQIPSSPLYSNYLSSVAKFISDSNPGAQGKALDIVAVYIKNQPDLLTNQSENISKALIEKCMTSAKNNIKTDSSSLILDFFAVHKDNFEGLINGLLQCINNKNVKVQASGISTVNSIISSFGIEKLSFKPFVSSIEKAASASNPSVRGEALAFYKECYRWVRELIKPYVEKLKKPQQDELQKAFEEITEYPSPTRWLKSEEARAKSSQGERKINKGLDIYDMADAKDIFTKYGESWANTVLGMEKWTDKKQALQELNNEANYPKLAEKSPIELVTLAKRLLNDSNLQVMLQSLKLVGLLAKGQRKFFESYARQFLPLILQKFKDKKTQVLQETHSTLDNLMYSLTFENVFEDVKDALEDSNPTVKTNTCAWLERVFESLSSFESKNIIKLVTGICKKNTDDSSPEVRNSTCKLLSVMLKKFPDIIGPLLKDLPAVKMKKIDESSVEAVPEKVKKEPEKKIEKDKPTSGSQKKLIVKEAPATPTGKVPKNQNPQAEEEASQSLTPEEAENTVQDLLPVNIIQQLKGNAWKEKQTGLLALQEWAESNILILNRHNEAILRFVRTTVKEWKENNFNVVKAAFELYKFTSEKCTISKRTAFGVLSPAALDKFSDMKLVEVYSSCIYAVTEVVGPKFVVCMLVKNTGESNKPKVVSECCGCIGRIVSEYGVHSVGLKEVVDYAKNGLNGANPQIKKASQSLMVLIYSFMGDKLISLLSDIKESTMKVLQEDFAKTQISNKTSFKVAKGQEEVKFDAKKILEDAITKNNIEKLITPGMLKKISDSNWKLRKEGLEEFEVILDNSGGRILPIGLESIVKALVSRLSDPNKALIRQALILSCKLANSLGSDSKHFAKQMFPAIINCLADKQNLLRVDALAAINKWGEEAGLDQVIIYSAGPLTTDNPELRNELLKWLLDHKTAFKEVDMKNYIQASLACLQDRSASIRSLAEVFFSEIVEIVTFDAFLPFLKDIKPAVMNTLNLIFEKYKRRPSMEESVENTSLPPKIPRSNTKEGIRSTSKECVRKKSVCATKTISQAELKSPLKKTRSMMAESVEIAIVAVGNKEKRLEVEARNKWSVEDIRPDFNEKLKDQMRVCFSGDLCALLLSQDFKKLIEGVGHINGFLTSQNKEIIEILDIIFRWVWIKMLEMGNTQLLKAIIEMIQALINMLAEQKYTLHEVEAGLFLPIMCEKSGNANFKTNIRGIMHSSTKIYPPEKVFIFVLAGCNSKNTKTKVECLEEIASLIQDFGISITQSKDVKVIAKHASSTDNNVRTAAVQTMGEIFKVAGDKTWGMIGEIPDKIRDLFEQRFKAVSGLSLAGPGRRLSVRDSMPKIITPKSSKIRSNFEEARSLTPYSTREEPEGGRTERIFDPESAKIDIKKTLANTLRKPEESKQEKKIEIMQNLNQSVKTEKPQIIEEKTAEFALPKNILESIKPKEEKTERSINYQKPVSSNSRIFVMERQSADVPISNARKVLEEPKVPIFSESDENLLSDSTKFEDHKGELDKNIEVLKHGDMSSKVDALVAINDLILNNLDSHKEELQKKANLLCDALTKVIINTFERPIDDIPLRFAKYFLNVVHKVCSTKIIMRDLTEGSLFGLVEQILTRLLIEELEKVGEKGEGEVMLKTLNGTMLRVLEHSRPTTIIVVLIKLLTKHKSSSSLIKMPGLVIRCLLKLTKVLNTVMNQIDVPKIFVSIHEHLVQCKAVVGDDLSIKTIKSLVNEIVKLQGNSVWTSYEAVRQHHSPDMQIEKWIIIMLNSSNYSSNFAESKTDTELAELFIYLNQDYALGVKKLSDYIEKNADVDLSGFLNNLPPKLSERVIGDLRKNKDKNMRKDTREGREQKGNSEIRENHETLDNRTNHFEDTSVSGYNFREFQRRLDIMKQRYGLSSNPPPVEFNTTLNDLKNKVNNLLNKSTASEDQNLVNDLKARIQNLNRINK